MAIMIISAPFELFSKQTRTPAWNESILLNEDYLHIVKPGTLVLFEVLDMLSDFKNIKSETDGWHRVAWAFLKLVGAQGQSNTEQKARLWSLSAMSGIAASLQQLAADAQQPQIRLQLYRYPWWSSQGRTINRVPFIFRIWQRRSRPKYPSTLYVQIEAHGRIETREVVARPTRPTEKETGRMTYEQLLRIYNIKRRPAETIMRSLLNLHTEAYATLRQCHIPNKLMYRIQAGEMGAFACSFSNNGLLLAVACANRLSYPIKLYDVLTGDRVGTLEGHQDLVYQLLWVPDDAELLSTSADGSVRAWRFFSDGSAREAAVYQHPTFVYTACLRPERDSNRPRILATGSYDGVIRFWAYQSGSDATTAGTAGGGGPLRRAAPKPMHKLQGHSSNINAIQFDADGHRLFSADAQGILKIWSSRSHLLGPNAAGGDMPATAEGADVRMHGLDYDCIKSITVLAGSPIHALRLHPGGRRLLVQTSVSLHALDIRIFRFLTHMQIPHAGPDDDLAQPTRPPVAVHGHASAAATAMPLQPISPAHTSLGVFTRACITPCGAYALCGSPNPGAAGKVFVWRLETGALVACFDSQHLPAWDDSTALSDNSDGDDDHDDEGDTSADGHGGHGRHHRHRARQAAASPAASPPVVDIAFHPKDHHACFVRWGASQPVRVWTWDDALPEVGLGPEHRASAAVSTATRAGGTGLPYFDVDAIVNKSMMSRLNLADSDDGAPQPTRTNTKLDIPPMMPRTEHRAPKPSGNDDAQPRRRRESSLVRHKMRLRTVEQGREAGID
nr:Jouberin [Polyrhizophydium stewartii]